MIKFNISLDKKLSKIVGQLKAGLPEVIDKSCKDTASYGKGLIIRSTAKDTGRTMGGWAVNRLKPMSYMIWNRFKHALYLETGTGIYGPRHRRIVAAEVTKSGGPFFWISWRSRSAKKGGNIALLSYAASTKGMRAQSAIKPNETKIQQDLNTRMRLGFRKLFQRARTAGAI